MLKRNSLFVILLMLCFIARAQVWPAEASKLNYRYIGFSFPTNGVVTGPYTLQIALGSYYSEDSFNRHIIVTTKVKNNRITAEVPAFGTDYTWRAIYSAKSDSVKTAFYHFTTLTIPEMDTTSVRLRIINAATKYTDAFVLLDANRAMYNMKGQPVWFLPDIDGPIDTKKLRDMKLTARGTITFLIEDEQAYEVDYNGKVLWKAAKPLAIIKGTAERYHHEFTRLSNGHYLALVSTDTSISELSAAHTNGYTRPETVSFASIKEYDSSGNVVWHWNGLEYMMNSDITNRNVRGTSNKYDAHTNSLFFDEQNKLFYLGFRNISRIIKIDYPTGNVAGTYGEVYTAHKGETGNGMFCRQHSVRTTPDGNIYLFDNGCDVNTPPSIKVFQQSATETTGLKKIWEYTCTADGIIEPGTRVFWLSTGGNVIALPDRSVFVCMGSQYSKISIVGNDKQVLWSAVPEKWNHDLQKWEYLPQYRASIVADMDQMNRLIWGTK